VSQVQLSKEERVGFKTPMVLGLFAALNFGFFGVLGPEKTIFFEISRPKIDLIQIPVFGVDSSLLAWVTTVVMFIAACYSLWLTLRNKKTPVLVMVIFGVAGLVTLLGWMAGDNKVSLAFILSQTLILSVPIILGAMGGIMCERVGVTNIAIEAQLLTGAFMAAVVSSITDNHWLGLTAAMVGGAVVGMVLAFFAIKLLAQQIIVGVVLNVLMIGITTFLYQQWLTEDSENVNFPGNLDIIKIPILGDIPVIGPVLFENRITVFAAMVIVPTLFFVLFKTKLGLRARAVGEHPLAADTVGINVGRTRFWWVTIGGMSAGLGGAALTIGNAGAFGREMSGGLGFIALAVVILGRWHPIAASLAALLFGFSIILRIWATPVGVSVPVDFITMVPYVVTIIAVVGFVGQSRPPKALAIPYTKG